MKLVITFLFFFLLSVSVYPHCSNSYNYCYKPPTRGVLPCGCNYFMFKKFVGFDCKGKAIYFYERRSYHRNCRYKYNNNNYSWRNTNYSWRNKNNYYDNNWRKSKQKNKN